MDTPTKARARRVAARKASVDASLFGRLLAAATSSRGQAQRLLQSSAQLSIIKCRVLRDLDEAGPLSIQGMALIQRTDQSLISRALPAMRAKGHFETARNAEDKRQSMVAMTPAGKRAFEAASPTMKRRRDMLADSFSAGEHFAFLQFPDGFEAFLEQPFDIVRAAKETS